MDGIFASLKAREKYIRPFEMTKQISLQRKIVGRVLPYPSRNGEVAARSADGTVELTLDWTRAARTRFIPAKNCDVFKLAFAACLNAPIPERAAFGVFRM